MDDELDLDLEDTKKRKVVGGEEELDSLEDSEVAEEEDNGEPEEDEEY